MSLELYTKQIDDKYLRQNFEKISNAFNDLVFTLGDFKFYEFTIKGAQTDFRLYHKLGFNPNDIMVTKAIGSSYQWDYSGFNDEYLTVQTTGDLYLRVFIGNMRGDEVTGSTALAGIIDDLPDTGGGSGGYTFYKKDIIYTGDRDIELQGTPIANSERVYLNGLLIDDANYTISGNTLSIIPGAFLKAGDKIYTRFSS